MSNAADGFGPPGPPPTGPPPPGYPLPPPGYPPQYPPSGQPAPQGYPPPAGHGPPHGYPGSAPPPGYGPPPGYPPPGYSPPPGYGPPPGYPPGYGSPAGYSMPGYPPPPAPPGPKPGVIPLRPMTLADIFNGAVAYIRANPKATLGLTAIVVVTTQIIALILQFLPLAATGQLEPSLMGEEVSTDAVVASAISNLAGGVATGLATILLSGLLTVVVGRAVFGAGISIGAAWERLRSRLLALIGFTVLETLGIIAIITMVVLFIVGIESAAGGTAAFVLGALLVVGTIALLAYLLTMLSFTPAVIVLERLGVFPAVARSFTLVRKDFWRVLGILLLAALVTAVIAAAVSVPFSFGGQLLLLTAGTATTGLIALILAAVGGMVGQIITTPFSAGVVVLLYTDRRIRAEAFDLVLQTGAAAGPAAPADSTDHLWLTRHP